MEEVGDEVDPAPNLANEVPEADGLLTGAAAESLAVDEVNGVILGKAVAGFSLSFSFG